MCACTPGDAVLEAPSSKLNRHNELALVNNEVYDGWIIGSFQTQVSQEGLSRSLPAAPSGYMGRDGCILGPGRFERPSCQIHVSVRGRLVRWRSSTGGTLLWATFA